MVISPGPSRRSRKNEFTTCGLEFRWYNGDIEGQNMTEEQVFAQMQAAIHAIYILHKDDRAAYEKAAISMAKQRLPEAPANVQQIFVKMAMDVFDEMQK
jgi:hypothetical protein